MRVTEESTLTPGLMVEATVMDFTYLPLAADGFMWRVENTAKALFDAAMLQGKELDDE